MVRLIFDGRGVDRLYCSVSPRSRPRTGLRLVKSNASAVRGCGSGQVLHAINLSSHVADDLAFMEATVRLADSSAGLTAPHPNAACMLVGPDGRVISSAFQWAQGTASAEVQAASAAGAAARGATAYLNLEPGGDCHGEPAALRALTDSGVTRVVVGMRHPLPHARGRGVAALRGGGMRVDVLGEAPAAADEALQQRAIRACLSVNEPLLHRAALGRPMSILK